MRKTYYSPKTEVMCVLMGTTILSGSGEQISTNVGLEYGGKSDSYTPF